MEPTLDEEHVDHRWLDATARLRCSTTGAREALRRRRREVAIDTSPLVQTRAGPRAT